MNNREIKFRVWSKVRGGWVENFLLLACIDGLPFTHFVELNEDKTLKKHHIYNASSLDLTIQQFTGLKDKNQKDIYEGDIINTKIYEDNAKGIVEFSPKYGYLVADERIGSLHSEWIVIGNIFENPELINKNP